MNPKVDSTLSTWANFSFWKGHPGTKFLDTTYSPKEMGIALHRWYDLDKAKAVKASGRTVDIWGWYLSDYEMELDVYLAMRRLDKYYTTLPDRASKDIRALSTELCFHGWPSIINAYVTAQKMWSPKRPLAEIEREFCAATFGDRMLMRAQGLPCCRATSTGRFFDYTGDVARLSLRRRRLQRQLARRPPGQVVLGPTASPAPRSGCSRTTRDLDLI